MLWLTFWSQMKQPNNDGSSIVTMCQFIVIMSRRSFVELTHDRPRLEQLAHFEDGKTGFGAGFLTHILA